VRIGDRVTVNGRTLPVVGLAVTAAAAVYPWLDVAQTGGPSHLGGLLWLTTADARVAANAQPPNVYLLDLKLTDPGATLRFIQDFSTPETHADLRAWQDIRDQDAVILRNTEPILVVGGWLLAVAAIVGAAALPAARAARQIRRVGLLKAVGATPGLISLVLVTEYLVLTVTGAGLGLLIATLAAPGLADPSADMLDTSAAPTSTTIVSVAFLAGLVALSATLGATLRAARITAMRALADGAHGPHHHSRLTTASVRLPKALLLGMWMTTRRPGRAVLTTLGTATAALTITALLTFRLGSSASALSPDGDGFGPSLLPDVRTIQDGRALLTITLMLTALTAINTLVLTWSTAVQARRPLTIARTLGATPGQVIASLCVAQLLPALPGTLLGIPAGLTLYWMFSITMTVPPAAWLIAELLTIPLAVAVLAALPAWIHTRRSMADILSTESG
jgi:putative ABC transport system permease protein